MAALLALLLLLASPAVADAIPPGEHPVEAYAQSDGNAGATPLRGDAVFRAFHGREGIARIADAFVERNIRDPRIKDAFATADMPRLKRVFAEQVCYLLGGGCAYTGRDVGAAHKGMGLQNADFNAIVENLQVAMDGERVPFRMQNALLAKLAPMQRVVVERREATVIHRLRRQLASVGAAQR